VDRSIIMVASLVAAWLLVPLDSIMIRRGVVSQPYTCTQIMVAESARTASPVPGHALKHGVYAVDLTPILTILNNFA